MAVDGAVTFCFPDEIATLKREHASRQQAWAGNIRPITPATSLPLAWQPRYPDLLNRRRSAQTQVATSPLTVVLPVVPPLAWEPEYADFARRVRPGLPAPWQFTFAANFRTSLPGLPQVFGWNATYPDSLRRVARAIPTTGTSIFAEAIVFTPYRAWAPTYPDRLWRTTLPSAAQPFLAEATPSVFPIPTLSWQGTYPSRHLVPRLAIRTSGELPFSGLFSTFTAWRPTYPDAVRRIVLPTAAQPFFTEVTPSSFPLPTVLSWQGRYPDQIDPKRGLRAALQPAWAYGTFAFIKNPPPTIEWSAKYPDYLRPKTELRTALQRTTTINLLPIVNPPAPDQSWQSTFQLPPRSVLVRTGTQPSLVTPPTSTPSLLVRLEWVGRQLNPSRAPAPQPTPPSFPFASLVEISVQGGWDAIYPDQTHRTLPPIPLGDVRWLGDVFPFVTGLGAVPPVCIEFTSETLTYSTLTAETLVASTLVEETLTAPTLIGEELC